MKSLTNGEYATVDAHQGVRDSKGVLTYAVILWPDSTSDEYFADEQDPTTGAVNGLSSFGRVGNVTAGSRLHVERVRINSASREVCNAPEVRERSRRPPQTSQ